MLIKPIKSQKRIAGGAFPPIIIIPIITLIQRSKLMFFPMIPETHSAEEIITVPFADLRLSNESQAG